MATELLDSSPECLWRLAMDKKIIDRLATNLRLRRTSSMTRNQLARQTTGLSMPAGLRDSSPITPMEASDKWISPIQTLQKTCGFSKQVLRDMGATKRATVSFHGFRAAEQRSITPIKLKTDEYVKKILVNDFQSSTHVTST